jgi:hypothetical protein
MPNINIRDIKIRDPFVVPHEGTYYLFGTTDMDISWRSPGVGFDAYRSIAGSLSDFEGPFPVFRPPDGFWAKVSFWAPEVYAYKGAYYMLATFKPVNGKRGTAVLMSDSILGPYAPWSAGPVTPAAWECLDGTLYLDGKRRPYMVFCHEWAQIRDGEVCVIPLTEDLKAADGEPSVLFRSSDALWSKPLRLPPKPAMPPPPPPEGAPKFEAPAWMLEDDPKPYVTDGPYLHAAEDGSLLMLWSAFDETGAYCIGVAKSETGSVYGPWWQSEKPLYSADGGHGMLFRALDGKLFLAIHSPNKSPDERALFVEIVEKNGCLSVKSHFGSATSTDVCR